MDVLKLSLPTVIPTPSDGEAGGGDDVDTDVTPETPSFFFSNPVVVWAAGVKYMYTTSMDKFDQAVLYF